MLPVAGAPRLSEATSEWRVGWTRGRSCQQLAETLGGESSRPLQGDLRRACISDKIDLLVARRLTTFDLVPIAVPHDVRLDGVRSVTAAVGGGPHSTLTATVAARIAATLGVPGELATLFRTPEDGRTAIQRLERIGRAHPSLGRRLLEASSLDPLVETLTPDTVLVLGAPGGSWLQRQFFGPGHRLTVDAPGGAIVVRSAPRRCFHVAETVAGRAAGPQLAVAEALRIFAELVVPVAEGGRLVGIVRRGVLSAAAAETAVADVMEPAVSVMTTEPLDVVDELSAFLDGSPVPVVDESGFLVGRISPSGRMASGAG